MRTKMLLSPAGLALMLCASVITGCSDNTPTTTPAPTSATPVASTRATPIAAPKMVKVTPLEEEVSVEAEEITTPVESEEIEEEIHVNPGPDPTIVSPNATPDYTESPNPNAGPSSTSGLGGGGGGGGGHPHVPAPKLANLTISRDGTRLNQSLGKESKKLPSLGASITCVRSYWSLDKDTQEYTSLMAVFNEGRGYDSSTILGIYHDKDLDGFFEERELVTKLDLGTGSEVYAAAFLQDLTLLYFDANTSALERLIDTTGDKIPDERATPAFWSPGRDANFDYFDSIRAKTLKKVTLYDKENKRAYIIKDTNGDGVGDTGAYKK